MQLHVFYCSGGRTNLKYQYMDTNINIDQYLNNKIDT